MSIFGSTPPRRTKDPHPQAGQGSGASGPAAPPTPPAEALGSPGPAATPPPPAPGPEPHKGIGETLAGAVDGARKGLAKGIAAVADKTRSDLPERIVAAIEQSEAEWRDSLLAAIERARKELPKSVAAAVARANGGKQRIDDLRGAIAQAAADQCKALDAVRDNTAAGRDAAARAADAVAQLADATRTAHANNAAHVALMEEIRDHLAAANQGLAEAINAQSRRQRRSLAVIIALLAGLIGAIVLHAFLTG